MKILDSQCNDEMLCRKARRNESRVAWIGERNHIFKVIISSSLGTTCHRDEDLFIRYKDGYQMMTDRGRVKKYDDN